MYYKNVTYNGWCLDTGKGNLTSVPQQEAFVPWFYQIVVLDSSMADFL